MNKFIVALAVLFVAYNVEASTTRCPPTIYPSCRSDERASFELRNGCYVGFCERVATTTTRATTTTTRATTTTRRTTTTTRATTTTTRATTTTTRRTTTTTRATTTTRRTTTTRCPPTVYPSCRSDETVEWVLSNGCYVGYCKRVTTTTRATTTTTRATTTTTRRTTTTTRATTTTTRRTTTTTRATTTRRTTNAPRMPSLKKASKFYGTCAYFKSSRKGYRLTPAQDYAKSKQTTSLTAVPCLTQRGECFVFGECQRNEPCYQLEKCGKDDHGCIKFKDC